MQYYTTIEQSKKLVELGLSPKTADMCYIQHFDESYNEVISIEEDPRLAYNIDTIDLPCWSLGALLELMPKIQEDENDGGCYPVLCKGWDNGQWHCVYRSSIHITEWYDNSIDAVLDMVCWLLENNYIKKGE